MTCGGAFASSWQFAAFWCSAPLASGVDDSGGAGNLFLTDSTMNFPTFGVEANVGQILYNLTKTTEGPVTSLTQTTITATGVTWDDGDSYRISTLSNQERSTIETYLGIAASDIHVAMAAMGACDCTLSDWAENYLAKLNIIDAAVYHRCPCGTPNLDADSRRMYLEWINSELEKIRTGEYELCAGYHGKAYPSIGWAEINYNEFSAARIISNRVLRGS